MMSEQPQVESSQLTDQGQKRRHNEDYVGFFEPEDPQELAASGRLYVVADGVGGAASGELASQYAVQKILYYFYKDQEPDLGLRLRRAVEAANADIYQHNTRHQERREMATTAVAALIHDDDLIVANVGDSRAYLVRGEEITQLSRDHSLVAEMVRDGVLSEEEAEGHPRRNVILRGLGLEKTVAVDVDGYQLLDGDVVVLCSDGLIRHVSDEEIAHVVWESPPQKAVRRLVDMANLRGGKDNIAVSVTRLGEPLAPSAPPEPEPQPKLEAPPPPQPDSRRPILVGVGAGLLLVALILGLALLGGQPASSPGTATSASRQAVGETPPPTPTVPTGTPTVPPPTDTPTAPLPTSTPTAARPKETPTVEEVEPFTGVVGGAVAVKVRKGPGSEYAAVLQIRPGTVVTVTGTATNSAGETWLLVDWDKRPAGFRDTWLLDELVEKRP